MSTPRRQLPPEIREVDVSDRRTGKTVVRYELRVDGGVNRRPAGVSR